MVQTKSKNASAYSEPHLVAPVQAKVGWWPTTGMQRAYFTIILDTHRGRANALACHDDSLTSVEGLSIQPNCFLCSAAKSTISTVGEMHRQCGLLCPGTAAVTLSSDALYASLPERCPASSSIAMQCSGDTSAGSAVQPSWATGL